MGAPAARVSELAWHWTAAGHDVTVLTGFPNHPDGVIRPEYRKKLWRVVARERVGQVKVVRSWLLPFPNRKAYERILNYSSFFASATITGSLLSRSDVVIASSPQLLVGLAGWWIAKVKKARFVLEVRDLWPESLAAVGVGSPETVLYRALRRIAGFLYRKADHIVVVTPAFRDYLVRHWNISERTISVVTNGVDTRLFAPRMPDSGLRQGLGIDGKFVASFIGTLGIAHGLETVLAAAETLRSQESSVVFMLAGDGAERERLMSMAQQKNLRNVIFVPPQPREKIPAYIAASDACLVLLKKSDVFRTVIPTKMLEFMSCARPVIVGVGGQAQELVERSGAGICIEPENPGALCDAITRMRNQPWLREEFGRNGREYTVKNLSRDRTAIDYLKVLTAMFVENEVKTVAAA